MLPLTLVLFYTKAPPEVAALLLMYGSSFAMRLPGALFSTVHCYLRIPSCVWIPLIPPLLLILK